MRKRNSIEGQLSLFPDLMEGVSGDTSPEAVAPSKWPAWPEGLWVGTSSWSFPGWAGSVYDRKYPESKLSQQGLRAYSRHPLLQAVGIDRTFYAPMSAADHKKYADQVPENFRFLVKAPERLTTARFSRHPRNGPLAGLDNPQFLSPQLALEEWIEPAVQGLGSKLGCLLLQFPPTSTAAVAGPAGFAIAPKYDAVQSFSEGLAAVQIAVEPPGVWGFIDKTGAMVITPQFVFTGDFVGGLDLLTGSQQVVPRLHFTDACLLEDILAVEELAGVVDVGQQVGLAVHIKHVQHAGDKDVLKGNVLIKRSRREQVSKVQTKPCGNHATRHLVSVLVHQVNLGARCQSLAQHSA